MVYTVIHETEPTNPQCNTTSIQARHQGTVCPKVILYCRNKGCHASFERQGEQVGVWVVVCVWGFSTYTTTSTRPPTDRSIALHIHNTKQHNTTQPNPKPGALRRPLPLPARPLRFRAAGLHHFAPPQEPGQAPGRGKQRIIKTGCWASHACRIDGCCGASPSSSTTHPSSSIIWGSHQQPPPTCIHDRRPWSTRR